MVEKALGSSLLVHNCRESKAQAGCGEVPLRSSPTLCDPVPPLQRPAQPPLASQSPQVMGELMGSLLPLTHHLKPCPFNNSAFSYTHIITT